MRKPIPMTLLGLCLAASAALADEAKPAEAPAAEATQADDGPGWSIWLNADEQYRLRAEGKSTDGAEPDSNTEHQGRFFLSGGFRDPSDRFGADLSAALWLHKGDITRVTDYRNPWWDVFTLQADYKSTGVLKLARIGRQAAYHGEPVTFDGARVEARLPLVQVFAFGGRSVHFFETRQDLWEDWLASGGLVMRPMRDLRIELDYRYSMEDVETTQDGSGDKEAIKEHGYGLTLWYRNGEWLRIKAHVRGLDSAVSKAGARFNLIWPAADLGADLGVQAQPTTLKQQTEREDPYFNILGESLPYLRWHVDLWKRIPASFGDFGIHVGWDGRQLLEDVPEDEQEKATFNVSFNRLYLRAEAIDVFTKGLFAQVSVEGHFTYDDSELTGDLFLTAGGSAGYRGEMIGAEVGTYYQRLKYDYYQDLRLINDVRTTFASFSVKPTDWLRIQARYEWERWDRDAHTALLSLAQTW